jgi:hypothetical protein
VSTSRPTQSTINNTTLYPLKCSVAKTLFPKDRQPHRMLASSLPTIAQIIKGIGLLTAELSFYTMGSKKTGAFYATKYVFLVEKCVRGILPHSEFRKPESRPNLIPENPVIGFRFQRYEGGKCLGNVQ